MGAAEMPQVPVRIADADWEQYRALYGKDTATEVRDFIAWQLGRPGAAEPTRLPAESVPPVALAPAVLAQLTAWYLRQPGAELPRRPGGETTPKMIRVPRTDWEEFRDLHGGKASEVIKMFIAWKLHRPGAELPPRLAAA